MEDLLTTIDNETLWALTDHLGSVRDMIDSEGTQRLHRRFDSFGNILDETYYDAGGEELEPGWFGYATLAFGFTGRPRDETTGLQNNLNRWYDPAVGRWLSEDPISFEAGDANLYRYVGNMPTALTDPTGLWSLGDLIHNLPFPANSQICNQSTTTSIWVYPGSTGQGEWLGPGDCTSTWRDQGDFLLVGGKWYHPPAGCRADFADPGVYMICGCGIVFPVRIDPEPIKPPGAKPPTTSLPVLISPPPPDLFRDPAFWPR